jgi:glyoxylate/hydroxypyruvate reductase
MAKTKVVVTRQLIQEAQSILDAKKEELDIVQWNSEKVRPRSMAIPAATNSITTALRPNMASREC